MTFIIVDVRLCYVVLFLLCLLFLLFQRQKTRKAAGPDGVSPSCLKVCADQLAIFSCIFNRSLELHHHPSPKEIHHDTIK